MPRVAAIARGPYASGGRGDSRPPGCIRTTIIASQPVARITTSTPTCTKQRQANVTLVQRISHGCHERAEREAVVLETHVRIAQPKSVDHRQYDRGRPFSVPISRFIQRLHKLY